jgi:WD40 repeat protein
MNKLRSLPLAFACGLLSTAASTQSVTAGDSAPLPVIASPPASQLDTNTLPPPPTINEQESPTGIVGTAYTYQFTAINGVAPLAWSETPLLTMGLSLSRQGVLSGTPTTSGQFLITLHVTDAVNRAATAAPMTVRVSLSRLPGGFAGTGSLSIPRAGHTATMLLTGKVLVAGGGNGAPDATAELYDAAARAFTRTTGNMTKVRSRHTATLLKLSNPADRDYGKVLILGSGDTTAELYDPATSTFTATAGSMKHARTSPTATLLDTGKVLIVGGSTTGDLTAELYDPASETFSFTGSTTVARSGHTATLLTDGSVLIAGGGTATGELYDPESGKFTRTVGNMTEPRSGHTATLLGSADGVQSGHVLIIGGDGTADLYNPSAETFARIGSLLPTMRPSYRHTASLLQDGTVLEAGGYNFVIGCGGQVQSAEKAAALFAPESDGFTATKGTLFIARDTHTATVLQDGTVLVVGGLRHVLNSLPPPQCVTNVALSSAELFMTAKPSNPKLTGYCWGSLFANMCGTAQDLTQCPVGQPAIAPTHVAGCLPPQSAFVDDARACTARNSRGLTIHGACLLPP